MAVVVDHVAHAYEYLAGWMRQIVAGQQVKVNSDAVDALNAQHVRDARALIWRGQPGPGVQPAEGHLVGARL